MLNLYQEIIMDHYRNPRNNRRLEIYDFCSQQRNSSCGDEVEFTGVIQKDRIGRISFQGKGCVISQAMASILSEKVINMRLGDVLALDKDDLIAMLSMPLGPVRLLCALLSLQALQKGIQEYKKQIQNSSF